ncbi:hypothetical protein [Streptomyces virginiae]|uniref:hypothetical protein n=1 Tax=Streptomyces virginiae TaxID=1961 RepID=UPI00365602EB
MAAAQNNESAESDTRQNQRPARPAWTPNPEPRKIGEKIIELKTLSNRQFTNVLAGFLASPEEDLLTAYAVRSPELARKARRLVRSLAADPEQHLEPQQDQESNNQYRERVHRFRVAAEREDTLLAHVLAGVIARRGLLPPEPNPRARARRRLADEYPQRYLELVREEQAADEQRAAEQSALREAARAAGE